MTMIIGYDLPRWRFYQSLEEDIERCFRYIEPAPEHYEVHSDEFAKIILLASSEFENILRDFQIRLGISGRLNITSYHSMITQEFSKIEYMELSMPRFSSETFFPLSDWGTPGGPEWWRNGYNKIKHDRQSHPRAASLKRALHSLGSLQIILLHFYKHFEKDIAIPFASVPRVIRPTHSLAKSVWGGEPAWNWHLPDEVVSE